MSSALSPRSLTLQQLHETVLRRVQNDPAPQLAIVLDGASGSGKTTCAASLRDALVREGITVTVLPVEHLYPGWDGLAAGSRSVAQALRDGGYAEYDWHRGAFAEWHALPPAQVLIVEGCGAFSAENCAAAAAWVAQDRSAVVSSLHDVLLSVWLSCETEMRQQRAIERDGDTYRPHWERWAAQERELFVRTRAAERSEVVVHTDIEAGAEARHRTRVAAHGLQ